MTHEEISAAMNAGKVIEIRRMNTFAKLESGGVGGGCFDGCCQWEFESVDEFLESTIIQRTEPDEISVAEK